MLSSFIAVSVAIIAVVISAKQTRDSNELLRKDLNNKLRPWLSLSDVEIILAVLGNEEMEWKQYLKSEQEYFEKLEKVRLKVDIHNIGTVPTRVTGTTYENSIKFTKNDLKNKGEKTDSTIILPGENISSAFEIPAHVWRSNPPKPYYFGIELSYELNKEQYSTVGKIWEKSSGLIHIFDSWMKE